MDLKPRKTRHTDGDAHGSEALNPGRTGRSRETKDTGRGLQCRFFLAGRPDRVGVVRCVRSSQPWSSHVVTPSTIIHVSFFFSHRYAIDYALTTHGYGVTVPFVISGEETVMKAS